MGKIYVEYLPGATHYGCTNCKTHIASPQLIIWQGYMGNQIPALLFREAINLDPKGEPRTEQLSTGVYSLVDVVCRTCTTTLGWKYLTATNLEQKYKEGSFLLEQAKITLRDTT